MKNTKLYSKGEEIFNGTTHIVGAAFGLIYLIFSVIYSALYLGMPEVVSNAVFGASMIILYVMSCLYHMISHEKAKRVFRIFDHCSIYLLIAGTYTPFMIMGIANVRGYIILALVWFFAVLGITLNATMMNKKAVKIFSYISYIVMGWCVLFIYKDIAVMPTVSIALLLAGGVVYSAGFVFYGLGKKKKWFHSVWHLFVLGGSVLHFLSIIFMMFIMSAK